MLRHHKGILPLQMSNHSQNRITYLRRYGPELLDRHLLRINTRAMIMARRWRLYDCLFCLADRCFVLAMSLIHGLHGHLGRLICLRLTERERTRGIADRRR